MGAPVFAQSCPTVCNSMGGSLPGSSVHGILQVRILEWVTISYSRGSFRSKIIIGPLGEKPRLGDGFIQINRCQSVLIIRFCFVLFSSSSSFCFLQYPGDVKVKIPTALLILFNTDVA